MIIGIDASRAYTRDRTGTENYSYHLINAILRLPESKLHTFVLFTRPNPILPKELDGYDNVIVKTIKYRYLWTQVGLAWETWARRQLDVLWIPAHTLPILRNPKIKTVVTIHGLEYQWLPEYRNILQKWYLPLSTYYAARSADKLIAVSKFTAKQLEKELHTSSEKIKVIWEGVMLDSRREKIDASKTLVKYGLQSKKYVLFVGSIQPRKNLVAIIAAFALLASKYPDLRLVIAGSVGWMAESVLSAPGKYDVQEKVIFTGRVSDLDLESLYSAATVYVQPSVTEGFGLPVLEAMKYQVPVVSSDGGALAEVVGNAGIVVPLNSHFAKNLAGAMERVITDKKLTNNLISMGLKRVGEMSWDRAGRETLKVITG